MLQSSEYRASHVNCALFAAACGYIHAFLFDYVVYCNKRLFFIKMCGYILFLF